MSQMSINIRNNFPAVATRLDRLGKEVGDRAMVRALNATVEQGKTQMAREISREYRITVGTAKERLQVRRASANGALRFYAFLEATRRGQGRSMNLIAFAERSVTLAQAKKRMKAGEGGTHQLRNGAQARKALELRFQIKRSGGKKMIPGAFIGNNGRTVFIRDGNERLPIKALNTIDIPQMFNARKINGAVRRVMLQRFAANFDREVRVVLRGFAR